MKKYFVAMSFLLILGSSTQAHAAAPEGKPKYASVNIYFGGLRPAKVFIIMDGKVDVIKCESGFMDQEEGELAVFSQVQTQLEKLGASGYKLQSTTSLAPSLITYTLVKE